MDQNTVVKNIWAAIIVAGCIFGVMAMASWAMEDETQGLSACVTEDSDNCYWDGSEHGNGQGRSFTVVDGEVTYWD